MPAPTSKNLGFASVLQKSGGPPPAPYKTSASPRFWAYFRLEIKKNSILFVIGFFLSIAFGNCLKNYSIFVNHGFVFGGKIFSTALLFPILKVKFSVTIILKRIFLNWKIGNGRVVENILFFVSLTFFS